MVAGVVGASAGDSTSDRSFGNCRLERSGLKRDETLKKDDWGRKQVTR